MHSREKRRVSNNSEQASGTDSRSLKTPLKVAPGDSEYQKQEELYAQIVAKYERELDLAIETGDENAKVRITKQIAEDFAEVLNEAHFSETTREKIRLDAPEGIKLIEDAEREYCKKNNWAFDENENMSVEEFITAYIIAERRIKKAEAENFIAEKAFLDPSEIDYKLYGSFYDDSWFTPERVGKVEDFYKRVIGKIDGVVRKIAKNYDAELEVSLEDMVQKR